MMAAPYSDWGTPISYIVGEELEELKQRIIRNMQAAGAVATGKTIQSLSVETRADGGKLIFRGRMPFAVMETGRRGIKSTTIVGDPRYVTKNPKVPSNFAQIIYAWMQAKGVHASPMPYKRNGLHKYASAQERGDYTMASAIAHTIAKSGTRLFRQGGRDTIYSKEIPQTVATIKDAVLKLAVTQVKSIKLNGGNTI